ncbi:hypothetical protein CHS0354_026987 [Potamilus streckersoni]|uniref:CUB domain-containing protein n=1 Tax=Potamilus streckersoni TaxID=2493646 RepID=A0AAE0SCF0_9BIVA|nr:hypothetical protein CHS0354_026987 [Potamilus streckersoni]
MAIFPLLLWTTSVVYGLKIYRMQKLCNNEISMVSEGIDAARLVFSSNGQRDCTVSVEAGFTTPYIRFHFEKMDIGNDTMDYRCTYAKLRLKDGESTQAPDVNGLPEELCGDDAPDGVYITYTRFLRIEFDGEYSMADNASFSIIFNAFDKGICQEGEHECNNDHCIAKELVCNGYNPCGDHSDCRLSDDAIVGIVLGIFGGLGIIISFICVYIRVIRPQLNPNSSSLAAVPTATVPVISSGLLRNSFYNNQTQFASDEVYCDNPPSYTLTAVSTLTAEISSSRYDANQAQFESNVDCDDNPPPYSAIFIATVCEQLVSESGHEDNPPPYSP